MVKVGASVQEREQQALNLVVDTQSHALVNFDEIHLQANVA
jgi:hypothetical protein